jgi:membrane dipeptidase
MTTSPILIDAHEDLAWNMLSFKRDYRRAAAETRKLEENTQVPVRNGQTVLGWPDYQRAQAAIIFNTLFIAPRRYAEGDWETQVFSNADETRRLYRDQMDAYRRLCDQNPDFFRSVHNKRDLEAVLSPWDETPASFPDVTHPVGLVMLIEGAEGIEDPGELEEYWQAGVRIIGPVWAGTRFCGAMIEPGEFTRQGYAFLDKMHELGFILDISHMNTISSLQALDHYGGPVIATHANARTLLKNVQGERHFTDATIHSLIERGGVMGVVMYNRFLLPDWKNSDRRSDVTLKMVADQIDYICQKAGNALHAGLGTDFDGGFGWPAVPEEINTIADLQKLVPILTERGYQNADISNILGGNWRRFLETNLP